MDIILFIRENIWLFATLAAAAYLAFYVYYSRSRITTVYEEVIFMATSAGFAFETLPLSIYAFILFSSAFVLSVLRILEILEVVEKWKSLHGKARSGKRSS